MCDDGEPTATSTAGGNYVLDNLSSDIDLSTLRIIVEVIPNETVDEDHPDDVIEKAYTLTSPPGKPEFVSPITTIVDAVMQNDETTSVEEAEEQVKENLGIDTASDVSLFDDYVAESNDETSDSADEYEKLHVVAQVVTEVIAESLSGVKTNDASPTDEEEFAENLNAVVSNIEDNLEQLVEVIETVTENLDEGETDDSAEIDIADVILNSNEFALIEEDVSLDATEVVEKVEEIAEERNATASDVELLLTEQEGFFFLDSHDERYWNGEQCIAEYEYSYDQFKIVDGIGQMAFWQYNPETQMFESEMDEEDDFTFYQLSSDGWQLTEDVTPQVVNFSEDGETLTVNFAGQGSRTIVAKQVELFGKPLADLERIAEAWSMQMTENTAFPADSTMYVFTMEQLADAYLVPVFNCGDDTEVQLDNMDNCNSIWTLPNRQDMTEQQPTEADGFIDHRATTLESLINRDWEGDPSSLTMFHAPFGHHYVAMALVEKSTDSEIERTILLFEQNYECHEGMVDAAGVEVDCQPFHDKGQSEWSLIEVNGQTMVSLELSDMFDVDEEFSGVFLTEVDGFVRQGMYMSAGRKWRDEYAVNETAMESLVGGFMAPTESEMVLEKEYCGFFDEGKDDDGHVDGDDGKGDDDGQDEKDDDGQGTGDDNNDGEREEQGPPPELVSDAANTQLLAGTTYLMEYKDEQEMESESIALQFNDNGIVEVIVVETEVEQDSSGQEFQDKEEFYKLGTWVIDDQGQLLVVLEHEYMMDDGQVNVEVEWKLFKVDGDISYSLTLVDETPAEDDNEVLVFEQLSPLSITSSMSLSRTEENGTACVITLSFEESTTGNIGNVDGSMCPNMADDEMTSLDFTWTLGEQNQVMIDIVDKEMGMDNHIQLFQNEQGTVYMLIHGVEEEVMADGTVEVHHFANIEQWQLVTQ